MIVIIIAAVLGFVFSGKQKKEAEVVPGSTEFNVPPLPTGGRRRNETTQRSMRRRCSQCTR